MIRRRTRRGSHKGRSTARCRVGGRRCHTSSQLLQRTTQKSSIISSPMPDEIVHHHFTSNPAGRGQIHGLGRCWSNASFSVRVQTSTIATRRRLLPLRSRWTADAGPYWPPDFALLVIAFDPETLPLDKAQFKDFNLHVENSEYPVTLGGEKLRREMGLSRKAGDGFDSRSWLSG